MRANEHGGGTAPTPPVGVPPLATPSACNAFHRARAGGPQPAAGDERRVPPTSRGRKLRLGDPLLPLPRVAGEEVTTSTTPPASGRKPPTGRRLPRRPQAPRPAAGPPPQARATRSTGPGRRPAASRRRRTDALHTLREEGNTTSVTPLPALPRFAGEEVTTSTTQGLRPQKPPHCGRETPPPPATAPGPAAGPPPQARATRSTGPGPEARSQPQATNDAFHPLREEGNYDLGDPPPYPSMWSPASRGLSLVRPRFFRSSLLRVASYERGTKGADDISVNIVDAG